MATDKHWEEKLYWAQEKNTQHISETKIIWSSWPTFVPGEGHREQNQIVSCLLAAPLQLQFLLFYFPMVLQD